MRHRCTATVSAHGGPVGFGEDESHRVVRERERGVDFKRDAGSSLLPPQESEGHGYVDGDTGDGNADAMKSEGDRTLIGTLRCPRLPADECESRFALDGQTIGALLQSCRSEGCIGLVGSPDWYLGAGGSIGRRGSSAVPKRHQPALRIEVSKALSVPAIF
jgi:hypothetical protein